MLSVRTVLCSLVALLLLAISANGQSTQNANWSTSFFYNAHAPSTAAINSLNKYQQFITIVLDGRSFDDLMGAYPSANGVPKALYDYRPQTDLFGNALASLPLCTGGTAAACGFPGGLANTWFDAGQYVSTSAMAPFAATQGYCNEQYQINNGREDKFTAPTVAGYPAVSNAGAWPLSWYNLTGSYLFQLAATYTLLDNHFHPSFGSAFANHQYLLAGRLPFFNNSITGCAAQNWTTSIYQYLPISAIFANNTINRCTVDGRITANIYPASYPAEVYSPTSPLVASFVPLTVPTTTVAGSPLLSDVTPPITGYSHLGDELDVAGVSWSWYAQGYRYVSASPVNFSAAQSVGFAWDLQPLLYFPKFVNLSSPYAAAHQQDDSAFFVKLAAGTLENVTFLKPGAANSFNPNTSTIAASQAYLATVMHAIFASPQYRAGHMLVHITFSSNGGLGDHGSVYKVNNTLTHYQQSTSHNTSIHSVLLAHTFLSTPPCCCSGRCGWAGRACAGHTHLAGPCWWQGKLAAVR